MWFQDFEEIEECGDSIRASIIKVRFLSSPPIQFGVVKRFPDFRSVHEKEAKLGEKIASLHPSFVSYYGCFKRDSQYNIVMELCSKGSIIDEISRRRSRTEKFWSEEALLDITLKLFEAMAALHKANLIHGDLKPDNLFVTDHDEVKIGDFGTGKSFEKTFEESTLRGTLAYFPPELMKAYFGRRRHYFKMSLTRADVWCMGRTVYEMAVLKRMRNLNIEDQEQLDDALMRTLRQRTDYSRAFCELLVKMHRVDPSERPRFSELIPELRQVQKLRSDLASLDFCEQSLFLYGEDKNISLESQQLSIQSYNGQTEQEEQFIVYATLVDESTTVERPCVKSFQEEDQISDVSTTVSLGWNRSISVNSNSYNGETDEEDQFIVFTELADVSTGPTEIFDSIRSFALSLGSHKEDQELLRSVLAHSSGFISLPCSHSLDLSCIENHLRERALDSLKCTQCQRKVPYVFLKSLTNSYIEQLLEVHFAVKMKSRCPRCRKEHSVSQWDKVYLAVTVTCSCSTRFCSLCYKSPPHRFMCSKVKRLD
jgi:NIMA (never in mitosis gene a)-related kinase